MIVRNGQEAISHLFTVAASLDSMVMGETQILSQGRRLTIWLVNLVYGTAYARCVSGRKSRCQTVQRETAIHRKRLSVPSIAVGEIIPEFFESLADKVVVIMGRCEMSAAKRSAI